MAVNRLNHAVLYVRDADRTATFYEEILGFVRLGGFPGAVFLRAPGSTNDHDVAFFSIGEDAAPSTAGRDTVGLYHLAWEVDTLDDLDRLRTKLTEIGALVGASDHGTTKSLYARDPDGSEFELVWLIPAALLDEASVEAKTTIKPLDLEKEIARFGRDEKGGIGISAPAR